MSACVFVADIGLGLWACCCCCCRRRVCVCVGHAVLAVLASARLCVTGYVCLRQALCELPGLSLDRASSEDITAA
eukprot:1183930-Alexandrium_andersonii.AAC.1